MKSTSDKYNFRQASPHGKFGFEAFKNEPENKFYFHFNNQQGDVLLFSQAYASARSRDNGLNSVQSYATDISRFNFHTKDGKHYFSLIAGNNQEIARSQLFDKKEEMEAAMADVIQFALGKAKPESVAVEKTATSEEPPLAKDTVAQTKSRITIDLYRNKAGEPLKGRIEHPLSGAKVKFQNYDRKVILSFIEQHIPAGEKQHRSIEAEVKAQIEESLPGIYTQSNNIKTQFIPTGASFSITIPVPAEALKFTTYNLEVYAKLLGESQINLLGKETAPLSGSSTVVFSVKNAPLQTGTYRLLVHLFLNGNDSSQQKVEKLQGSCLLLVQ